MRKKYLSALLFGALLFASAGTFTSCKDYDDDIDGLRTEITDLKSAISELQKAVQDGKYVTAVSGNGNVITFTFTDGTTQEVAVETESGEASQTVTIGEDGEVIINGEGTGYYTTKTPTEAEVEAGLVKKGANGTWEVLGENGEYTDTKIPVSGISVSGSVAEGYTFTIVDANGKTQEVKLPSAASAITSIDAELIGNTNAGEDIDGQVSGTSETISINEYNFDTESNKKRWKDLTDKDITSNKAILTSANVIAARINPVSAEATQVNFSLTNSKNETLPNVVFKATEYKGYVTDANVDSRADYGNGLYTLDMQSLEAKDKETVQNTFKLTTGENKDNILYALNAQNACRGDYQFAVNVAYDQTVDFKQYIIAGDKKNLVNEGTEKAIEGSNNKAYTYTEVKYTQKLDAKVAHSVAVYDDMSEIYDMWLTAEDYDVELFDLTFDQEKHTFTVNADPDIITKANFTLTVHTLDNNGIYRAQPIVINVSNKIVADANYATREWGIVDDEDKVSLETKNAFFADMKTMTDGLGSQLAAWQRKVNGFTVEYFTDADCKNAVKDASKADVIQKSYYKNGIDKDEVTSNNSGIDLIFVNANRDKEVAYKDAVDMKFAITNATASDVFSVDKVYYARVTFYDAADALNSIVVPFELSIPELSTLFATRDGYVVDGVINAYFYQVPATGTPGEEDAKEASAAVELERYFSKYVADANVELTGKIGDKNSTELFAWGTMGNDHNDNSYKDNNNKTYQYFAKVDEDDKVISTTIELTKGIKDGKPDGAYGEAVTVKVTKDNYYGWTYQAEGADEYSFQIRLMSPVYEGSIAVLTGERVIVSANDFVKGANITEKDIEGHDYTGVNNLYIFPDKKVTDESPSPWKNQQIWNVTPGIDKEHYIEEATMKPVTTDKDGNITANGVINIKGRQLSNDTDIDLPVKITDAWGYELDVTVPVTIKVGE
ncbi:hypothetical protein [Phocaeicola salanitronis]|uniref:hypothetical protein n=1 Tax=Phocaeicola salanitronis TaxID=376805 RepID=UPI00320A7CC2